MFAKANPGTKWCARRADEALRGLMAYDDIAFCRRPDGKLWLLGAGTHGKARTLDKALLHAWYRS